MMRRLGTGRASGANASNRDEDHQAAELEERVSNEDNGAEQEQNKKPSYLDRLVRRTTRKQRQELSHDLPQKSSIPSDLAPQAGSGADSDFLPVSGIIPFVLNPSRPITSDTSSSHTEAHSKPRQKSSRNLLQFLKSPNSLLSRTDSGDISGPSPRSGLRLFRLRPVRTVPLDTIQPDTVQSHRIQSDIDQSDIDQSDLVESCSISPDIIQPDITDSELVHSTADIQPDFTDSEPIQSDADIVPDIIQPDFTDSEPIQSETAIQLDITDSGLIESDTDIVPDTIPPVITDSELIQSDADIRKNIRQPDITDSELVQSTTDIQPDFTDSEPIQSEADIVQEIIPSVITDSELIQSDADIVGDTIQPDISDSELNQLDADMAAADRLSFLMVEKPHARFAIQEARKAEREIREILSKTKTPFPPYNFLELIGKGTYGRVYKVKDVKNRRFVALKIVDCDAVDFKAPKKHRDLTIAEMIKETNILVDLKQHGVKNINTIFDAFELHSQVWILSEYCPGGSIKTLMRAQSPLEEKYIKVIARELAIGLESIHSIGVLHRDIKGANVMIHERGEIQIIDFGVAATLSSLNDKRSTRIGTPHWMSPELMNTGRKLKYGKEVDVWAYGCTLFEMATGLPPGAGSYPDFIELMKNPPRLEDESYSVELREFVAYILQPKTEDRRTMTEICAHQYISENQEEYPTRILSEMVRRFQLWEQAGNQRISLINPKVGAALMQASDFAGDNEDWNFSTTAQELDDLELDITVEDIDTALSRDALPPTSQFPALLNTQNSNHASDPFTSSTTLHTGDQQQSQAHSDFLSPSSSQYLQPFPRLVFESDSTAAIHADDHRASLVTMSDNITTEAQREVMNHAMDDTTMTHSQGAGATVTGTFKTANGKSIERGAATLHDIYDPKATDLPLRTSDDTSTNHQELQVGAGPSPATPAVVLSNVATVRANAQKNKRKTMEWSFADATAQAPAVPSRPQLLHSVTAPAGPVHDAAGALDLDAMMQGGTGTLDLDALMAGDSEAESSTARPYGQNEEEEVEEDEEEEIGQADRFATGALRAALPATRPPTVIPPLPPFPYHVFTEECTDDELVEALQDVLKAFGDGLVAMSDRMGEMVEEGEARGDYEGEMEWEEGDDEEGDDADEDEDE